MVFYGQVTDGVTQALFSTTYPVGQEHDPLIKVYPETGQTHYPF
jgi:hypothetical protein